MGFINRHFTRADDTGISALAAEVLYIWYLIVRDDIEVTDLIDDLSGEEQEKARLFKSEPGRARFIVSRYFERAVLAQHTGLRPRDICYSRGPYGKPGLENRIPDRGLSFNLSHSKNLIVIAVTGGPAVGVDAEFGEPGLPFMDIAGAYFHAAELEHLRRLPEGRRDQDFFRIWTSKEAYIKAIGMGLSRPLASFSILVGDQLPDQSTTATLNDETGEWSIIELSLAPGYYVTAVVQGRPRKVALFKGCPGEGRKVEQHCYYL
jgi:4'-phosphopantetheinyl transferase